MDKKPPNPRSNKPKASHHGSELFALGSKPGTSREDASKKSSIGIPISPLESSKCILKMTLILQAPIVSGTPPQVCPD